MSNVHSIGAVQIGSPAPSGSGLVRRINRELAHAINHLIHRGYDVTSAYTYALERLTDEHVKERLQRMKDSHDAYQQELGECVRNLGHVPATSGDLHSLVERGRVLLGGVNGQEGIVRAMDANEAELAQAYREAQELPGMPQEALEVIQRALNHEVLHRAAYDELLDQRT